MDFINNILHNPQIVMFIMAFVIFLATELIKQPIKLLTKKLTPVKRRLVNSLILLLPFGLGILGEFLMAQYYFHDAFDVVNGVLIGGEAIAMYGILERFFGLKVSNSYQSEDGQLVVDAANEIVAKKKVNFGKLFSLFSKLFSKKEKAIEGQEDVEDVDGVAEAVKTPVDTEEDNLKKILDKIK